MAIVGMELFGDSINENAGCVCCLVVNLFRGSGKVVLRPERLKTTQYLAPHMRHLPPHVSRRLVLAQPFISNLSQEVVFGPGQKLDLGDQLRTYPMHAA